MKIDELEEQIKEEDLKEFNEFVKKIEEEAETWMSLVKRILSSMTKQLIWHMRLKRLNRTTTPFTFTSKGYGRVV
jgi:vacuolar-type H+-ATPase subunit E/Vma4